MTRSFYLALQGRPISKAEHEAMLRGWMAPGQVYRPAPAPSPRNPRPNFRPWNEEKPHTS